MPNRKGNERTSFFLIRRSVAEREKSEDVFTNFWMKTKNFSDTSQQASQKCESWRNHFSRHRKTRQNKKNKCKTCPTNKGNRQNLVFFCDTTEKESLTEVYKDSKNCEKKGYR